MYGPIHCPEQSWSHAIVLITFATNSELDGWIKRREDSTRSGDVVREHKQHQVGRGRGQNETQICLEEVLVRVHWL